MVALAVRLSAAEERTRRVAEFIVAQYDTVAAAAEGCAVLLATGMSHFVAQSVIATLLLDALSWELIA